MLEERLAEAKQELDRVKAQHLTGPAHGADMEAWQQERSQLLERVRELEARCDSAVQAEGRPEKEAVVRVMAAVGSGCTEATARRLLAACANQEDKAARLAKQVLSTYLLCVPVCVSPCQQGAT